MSKMQEDKVKSINSNVPAINRWYVIYTKPRHEKRVASMLTAIGIEVYCPLKVETRQWSDRKKNIEMPLFNSYLFVKLTEGTRSDVFVVPGVVRYIYWCGKPAIVSDQEIEEIRRWLNDFDHLEIEVNSFEANQKVRILSGSFANREAKIVKQQGNHLVLTLEGLGLVLRTKLSETLLEKILGSMSCE